MNIASPENQSALQHETVQDQGSTKHLVTPNIERLENQTTCKMEHSRIREPDYVATWNTTWSKNFTKHIATWNIDLPNVHQTELSRIKEPHKLAKEQYQTTTGHPAKWKRAISKNQTHFDTKQNRTHQWSTRHLQLATRNSRIRKQDTLRHGI